MVTSEYEELRDLPDRPLTEEEAKRRAAAERWASGAGRTPPERSS